MKTIPATIESANQTLVQFTWVANAGSTPLARSWGERQTNLFISKTTCKFTAIRAALISTRGWANITGIHFIGDFHPDHNFGQTYKEFAKNSPVKLV